MTQFSLCFGCRHRPRCAICKLSVASPLSISISRRTSTAEVSITRGNLTAFARQFFHAFYLPVNLISDGDWAHVAAFAVRALGLEGVVCSGPERPHSDYPPFPPWASPLRCYAASRRQSGTRELLNPWLSYRMGNASGLPHDAPNLLSTTPIALPAPNELLVLMWSAGIKPFRGFGLPG